MSERDNEKDWEAICIYADEVLGMKPSEFMSLCQTAGMLTMVKIVRAKKEPFFTTIGEGSDTVYVALGLVNDEGDDSGY